MFAVPFDQIAPILQRTPVATRGSPAVPAARCTAQKASAVWLVELVDRQVRRGRALP
jgi:hypothetical protein